jgi:hypothetical protein
MPRWVLVAPDGTVEERNSAQGKVHEHLGGPLTIVGAIPSLNAVVVALRDAGHLDRHGWNGRSHFFAGDDVRGAVAVVASDDRGEEEDLDVNEFLSLVEASKKKDRPQ